MRKTFFLLVAIGCIAATVAGAQEAPVKWQGSASTAQASAGGKLIVTLRAEVDAGWHIYSVTQPPGGPTPTAITLPPGQPFTLAGTVTSDPPHSNFDPNFGMQVEQHEGTVTFSVPVAVAVNADGDLRGIKIDARYQACTSELCLPPQIAHVIVPIGMSTAAAKEDAVEEAEPILRLGDTAPAIQVSEWIKGKRIERYEPGKPYVVEFWATWCGPCKDSMPHLSALARKYREQVDVISVSVWEHNGSKEPPTHEEILTKVTRFVKGKGAGMDYTVALDGKEGQMADSWLKAVGQDTIPAAFIVQDGKMLWMGHPRKVDEPLAQILAGEYDMTAALLERRNTFEDGRELKRLRQYQPFKDAIKAEDSAAQLRLYETAFAMNPRLEKRACISKFSLLLTVDKPQAYVYAQECMNLFPTHDVFDFRAFVLSRFASNVMEMKNPAPQDLQRALQFARESFGHKQNKGPEEYSALASAYFANGEKRKAVELQKQALKLAETVPEYDPTRESTIEYYRKRLDKYLAREGAAQAK